MSQSRIDPSMPDPCVTRRCLPSRLNATDRGQTVSLSGGSCLPVSRSSSLSGPVRAASLPLGETVSCLALPTWNSLIFLPVATSHNTRDSEPYEASTLPRERKATVSISSLAFRLIRRRSFPVALSQRHVIPKACPEASVLPSGENASVSLVLSFLSWKVRTSLPEAMSH